MRASRGIVFYIAGDKINYYIPVALKSLQRYYRGPIAIVVDPSFNPLIIDEINAVDNCVCVKDSMEHGYLGTSKQDLWCRKAWHHIGQYPFDVNLYYDLDHLWVDDFDYSIFDAIVQYGLLCTSANKAPHRKLQKKRAAQKCIGRRLPFFHGVNGGCVGAVYNSPQAKEWISTINKTKVHDSVLRRNPEEFALAILKATGVAGTASLKWSMPISPRNFKWDNYFESLPDHIALHGTRGTCIRLKEWCGLFIQAYNQDFMKIRTARECYGVTDDLFKRVKEGEINGI